MNPFAERVSSEPIVQKVLVSGSVIRVFDSTRNTFVVQKRVLKNSPFANPLELSLVGHTIPNVVPILSVSSDDTYHYLTMPKMTPLNEILCPSGGYSAKDLIRGLYTLQSLGLVHNDIKSHHVFIDDDHYYLGDFEMMKSFPSRDFLFQCPLTGVTSPLYRCPQSVAAQISNGHFNAFALDIWSLGVLLYEAAVGRFPVFPDDRSVESLFDLLLDITADKINMSEICDDFIREIVEKLLTIDPSDRMSNFDELCLRLL
ncbi:hypothetical protein RCL1_003989 [Eukaryota sp. TZLM3-RCL]